MEHPSERRHSGLETVTDSRGVETVESDQSRGVSEYSGGNDGGVELRES